MSAPGRMSAGEWPLPRVGAPLGKLLTELTSDGSQHTPTCKPFRTVGWAITFVLRLALRHVLTLFRIAVQTGTRAVIHAGLCVDPNFHVGLASVLDLGLPGRLLL